MRIVPVNSVKGEVHLARDIMSSKNKILLKKGVLLKLKKEKLPLRKNLLVKSMEKYIEDMKHISRNIIEDLTNNSDLLINMVDLKNVSNYTYEHSVNVAIISLILGIELKLSRKELQVLFIGALLHDIGKTLIPKEIVNKKDELTEEEKEIMKKHPELGFSYLRENFNLSPRSNIIALEHHERVDGMGYPKGAIGRHIHMYAKIVAVADVFDAMTSDKPYKKALPTNEAIEYIMGNAGTQFDFKIVDIFSKKLMPYPNGTLVKLSNGKICVVLSQNIDLPMRPNVKVIEKNDKNFNLKIDLTKDKNLVIEKIVYTDPNK